MDAVTEILLERSRVTDNISRMVILSLIAHAGVVTAFTLLPRPWGAPRD